jgi:hypothetical protein
MYGLAATGWSGRFFDSLDSTRKAGIPDWIFELHRKQTRVAWPYSRSGVVLVHSSGKLIVLESGDLLENSVPVLETDTGSQEHYGLPARVPYTFWFDVVYDRGDQNDELALFHLPVTSRGDSVLSRNRLSSVFPAVLAHVGDDYQFYYFAGDFSDNPIELASSRFRGIHWFQTFFYNPRNVLDRRGFFWKFYRPLMSTILTANPVNL